MNPNYEAESPVYTRLKKELELPSKPTKIDNLFKANRISLPNAPEEDQAFDTKTMKRIKKFGQGHGLGKFTEFMGIIDSLSIIDSPNDPKNDPKNNPKNALKNDPKNQKKKMNELKKQKSFYNQVKSFAFHEESEAVISEHGEIKGLCFSPNRQMIASATQECIRIWDSKSKKLLTSLQYQGDFDPMSIVISDTLVLVGGVSGSIRHHRLYTSPSSALLHSHHHIFNRHKGPVQVLLMTRDCQTLISGGDDGLIVIWSLIDSNIKHMILAHKSAILSLALDSKENVLVSGGEDKVIKVWNFENGKALKAFPSRGNKVLAIDVSSDGKYLAIGNSDRTLRIFEMCNGEEYATITETDPIKALVFVPQAEASDKYKDLKKTQGLAEATKVIPKEVTLIFTTSSTLMIYNVLKKEVSSIRQGHTKPIIYLSIMSNGSKVASASSDRNIRIWSLKKEEERNVLFMDDMKEVKAIRTTNDYTITGGVDRQVRVWCLKTGELLSATGKEREMPSHKAEITAIAISHDGRLFATGDGKEFEGEVNICVKVGGSVELNENPFVKWCPKFIAHPDSGVVALKFLKTEDNFLSLGDTCLKVWKLDTEGRKARTKSEKHLGKSKHNTMDVDAEEERVIVGNQQGQLVVYSLLDPKLGELIHINAAHSPSVVAVKFTLFGGKVISAGTDSTIKVWDFKTNPPTMLNCFQMKYFPKTIELTSDNSRVITSWDDKSIRVFEIETLKQVGIVEGVEEVSKAIALTPDQSRLLISGGSENRIKILDLAIMKTMRVLRGHYEEVSCLAISQDGRVLASGSHDFTIKIWDLTDASKTAPMAVLGGHVMNLTCLRFLPNTKNLTLVSGSLDNTIRLWESRNSKFEPDYVFKKASNAIIDIAIIEFGTDRTVLGIFSIGDRTIRVWDFETRGDPDFGFSFPPASSPIHCLAVHKKEQKVFAGTNSKIYVYNLDDKIMLEPLEGHEMPVRSLAISECSNKLFSGSEDRNIRVWNLEDFSLITTLRGHSLEITSLVVNDEGSNLFSASKDKTILMWDIQNYKRLTQFEGHNGPIQDICLSSDQKTLFSGSTDNLIRVWDLDDSAHFLFLEGHSLSINDLVMTPDGKELISAGCDNKVIIWNFETGKQKKILRSETEITGLALNSKGNLLFGYSNQDKNILMWDLTTSSFDVVENVSPSDCLAVESNDKFLVAGCSDSVVRVITLCSDPEIIEFEGHCGNVRSILISKDSKILISGGNDGLIKVWNYEVENKVAIKTLSKKDKNEKAVLCLYLYDSDDSKLLIAGYATGKIYIWNLDTDDNEKVLFPNKYSSPIRYLGMNSGYLLIGSQADLQYVDWKNRSLIKSEQLTNNKMIIFPKNEQSLYLVAACGNELEIMELQPERVQIEESKQEQDDDKKVRKILGIPEQITAETMSPNKEMLIFSSSNNCIYVWHLYKSELLAHFEGHSGEITSLLVSKDNNMVFSSSLDKKIGVWSISENHLLSYLNGHSDSVMCLAFSPSEGYLFSGSNDGVVITWNIKAVHWESRSQNLGQNQGVNYNFKQEKKYRIEGNVLSLEVHSNVSYFICGGSAKTIYMIDCSDGTQNDKPVKKLILSSAIKRLMINGKNLIVYLENSKMLICETHKYTVIRELELKKDNFRTLPVFVTIGNNPLMLYFEKLIDVKTGEVIFDFETIEELYTFFYDVEKEVYYYISKNFQLFHFKMSYFNDFLSNYLNYDSLTRFDDASLACQRKQSVFPFFFSFMHLIAIFDKGEYFTKEKLMEIYEGDVKIEYFYSLDVFMNTPLDILLVKKDATLIDKYFQLFYIYFSQESTTFAQKARFLNYGFRPNYNSLDLLNDLIPLCDEDVTFIGSYLEKCFIDLDQTVYNNTLSFEELEKTVIIETDNFQTNDEAFLREELEKKLEAKKKALIKTKIFCFPGKKDESKEKDLEEAKKKALIKAKIFCIPNIGNIFNPETHNIFSRISDCNHDSEIFRNKSVSILAHHIWDSQIKYYYLIELFVFLLFFILFNINTIIIYENRLGSAETIREGDAAVTIYPREDSTILSSIVIDALILFYALFNLINEARELYNSGLSKYSKSVWNYFDVLLIPLLFCSASFDIYLSNLEFDPNPKTADSLIKPFKLIFSVTMFCFWMRFISYFRAIAETSSMIRLIFTVINAIKSFILFMLLFMGTLTATFFPLHIDDPENPPLVWETFMAFYKSTVGDSSGITDYSLIYPNLGTFFMICSTFLFAIMLLNLLVSIIGDKHGEIKDAEEKTRLYELVNILVDSNSSLITKISKWIKSLFKETKMGTYAIYLYNKTEEKKEDQLKNLEETTINKIDEIKNFTEGLINEKNKQISKLMIQNTKMIKFITDCVVPQKGGVRRASKFKTHEQF